MNLRKITSMTMLVSFVFCVVSSIILYIVPHGRVAFWTDWHLWGLTRTQWSNLHINLGFLLLIAGLLHLYYNWSVIMAYMKNKARELKVFTPSFIGALLMSLVVGLGTYYEIPPMSTILELSESIKEAASDKYGEPPYGHAELSSLKLFTRRVELDLEKSKELLVAKGIRFENDQQSIYDISKLNALTPQLVYEAMKEEAVPGKKKMFPDEPYPGFGRKTLGEICTEFQLDTDEIVRGLAGKKIKAASGQTIKEIAEGVDMDPHQFFEILHNVVHRK